MAQKQRFYEAPVDQTPYGACAVVGIIAGVIFVAGAFGLVRAGGWFQHFLAEHQTAHLPSVSLPSDNPFQSAQDELNNFKQSAADQAKQAAKDQVNAAVDSAASQLQDAAQASAEQQVDTLKNGVLKK